MSDLFVVRHYDGFDNRWIDLTGPVSRNHADAVFNEYTENGSKNTSFDDIDYYKIFPANTEMMFSEKGKLKWQ
jgi:hypothetical protein